MQQPDALAVRERLLEEAREEIRSASTPGMLAHRKRHYARLLAASDADILAYAAHMIAVHEVGRP